MNREYNNSSYGCAGCSKINSYSELSNVNNYKCDSGQTGMTSLGQGCLCRWSERSTKDQSDYNVYVLNKPMPDLPLLNGRGNNSR